MSIIIKIQIFVWCAVVFLNCISNFATVRGSLIESDL